MTDETEEAIEEKIKEFDKILSSFLGEYLIIDSHFRNSGNGMKTALAFREKLFDELHQFLRYFAKCIELWVKQDEDTPIKDNL